MPSSMQAIQQFCTSILPNANSAPLNSATWIRQRWDEQIKIQKMNTGMQVKSSTGKLCGFGWLGFFFSFCFFILIGTYTRDTKQTLLFPVVFLSQKMLMLPQTTLQMKAPSSLCAAVHSRIQFGNAESYFTCTCQWTAAFYFSKGICTVIQYVPFFFYIRILHPILVQTLFLFVTNQTTTTQTVWQVPQWALDMTSFDFTHDSYHRRLWCFNRHNFTWSCFIL